MFTARLSFIICMSLAASAVQAQGQRCDLSTLEAARQNVAESLLNVFGQTSFDVGFAGCGLRIEGLVDTQQEIDLARNICEGEKLPCLMAMRIRAAEASVAQSHPRAARH